MVAAGTASRFGTPKQFALLGGRPVVEWSVAACRSVCEGVVLVLPADRALVPPPEAGYGDFSADIVVTGGATRSASVRCGLSAVPSSASVVVVHDAARPLATPELFKVVVGTLLEEKADGVVCALPVVDTLKRLEGPLGPDADGGASAPRVRATIDRSELVAVQTPQAFVADVLRRCHEDGDDATDDACLLEAHGATVRVVRGDPANIKLTTPKDLALAEWLAGR